VFKPTVIRVSRLIAVTAVAIIGCCTAAQAKVLVREKSALGISSVRGMAVWSTLDPSVDRYRLRLYANGVVRTLKVRPRLVPFDVDLGIDGRGHTVAVYSRCRQEGTNDPDFPASSPNWQWATGCDLYELPIAGGAERKLRGPSAASRDEFMPSLDGEHIAFARRNEDGAGVDAVAAALRLYDFRTRKTRPLPEGTRGDYAPLGSFNGRADWLGGPGPTGLDLRGGALAVSWGYADESCDPDSKLGGVTTLYELWVMTTAGKKTLVDHGTCNAYRVLSSPVLTQRSVLYLAGSSDRMRLTRFIRRSHQMSSGLDHVESISGTENVLFAIQYGTDRKLDVLRVAPEFGTKQP
jgi:hypothetical protein